MKKFIPLLCITGLLFFTACVKKDRKCVKDHKKGKKNHIGWQY
jgi:hypothetical protein